MNKTSQYETKKVLTRELKKRERRMRVAAARECYQKLRATWGVSDSARMAAQELNISESELRELIGLGDLGRKH